MTSLDRLHASVQRHWPNLGQEAVTYAHAAVPGGSVSGVRSVWGKEELADGGQGVWVYQAPVSLLTEDLVAFGTAVAVHPAGELVRYPDPWPTAQRWYLISASPGTGVWRCLAQRPVG